MYCAHALFTQLDLSRNFCKSHGAKVNLLQLFLRMAGTWCARIGQGGCGASKYLVSLCMCFGSVLESPRAVLLDLPPFEQILHSRSPPCKPMMSFLFSKRTRRPKASSPCLIYPAAAHACCTHGNASLTPPPPPPHYFSFFHQAGAEVDAEAKSGVTALWLASGEGRKDVLKELLKSGASANNSRSDGITALMGAAAGGHGEVVDMLLKAGMY